MGRIGWLDGWMVVRGWVWMIVKGGEKGCAVGWSYKFRCLYFEKLVNKL